MHAHVSTRQEPPPESLPGYRTRWIGLVFIGISLLVISLDNTILNVALPAISTSLGADLSELQWIIDAYILVFASLLLTMGALSDRFGRKRALQAGLVIFGIGSLLAALSTSTEMLIATRAFLGVGAAIIMPSTLSIITASFPANERPQAIALWAAIFGLGVGIGPVIGGLLLKYFEWNAVFFVNLPVVAVALTGGQMYLGESRDENAPRTDIAGVILSIIGLFALVYGIVEAGVVGWTADNVLAAFAVAAVFLLAFAWWENRYEHAMLPLYFFRNMSFTGASITLGLVVFSLLGSIFFLSQYLQTVLGYTALEAGVRLLPQALMLTFMAAISAQIGQRLGTKLTVALGIGIGALGLFYMSQNFHVGTSYGTILTGMLILAGGLGLAMAPATNSIMGSVPVSKAGIGSAMNDTVRELGGAMGVAVLGTLLNSTYLSGVKAVTSQVPAMAAEGIERGIQGAHMVAQGILGAQPPVPGGDQIAALIFNTSNQAFVDGMNSAMLVGVFVMIGAVLFTLAFLPAQVQRPAEDEAVEAPEGALAAAPVGD